MYSTCLIGAGNIGALYDLRSQTPTTLSHLTKLLRDDRIDLKFIIEREKSMMLAEIETQIFTSVSKAPKVTLDMIVVCVDTENLVDCAIEAAIKFTPKLLIIEKPVSFNPAQIQRLKKYCDVNDIKVFVNFMRRYLPEVQQMHQMFACSSDDQFFVECNFGSSILNNGIHYLDLHQYFFGEIQNIEAIHVSENYDLYLVRSANVEGMYRNDHRSTVRNDNFTVSNSLMRARYMNGGQAIYVDKAMSGPLFPNVTQYFYSETLESNIAHYMDHFYEEVIESKTSYENSSLDDLIKLISLVLSINNHTIVGDNS